MKILITGAKGQLGQDLMAIYGDSPHFISQGTVPDVRGIDVDTLDITDLEAVREEFNRFKPEIVINSAAYTDVDGCETNQETAYKVNAVGPANLAIAAQEVGAGLLHVSTDYVFDGSATKPYLETDPVNPQSIYGLTKLAGELAVQTLAEKWFIARTAWLYGHGGNNFVKTIQKVAKEKGRLKVVNDQQGSPTFSKDLAEKIAEIVASGQFGLYHVTNSGQCSWYDFAKEIVKLSGIEAEVTPCTTDEFPRPAKRPAYSVMVNHNLELRGIPAMRPWQEALRAYLDIKS